MFPLLTSLLFAGSVWVIDVSQAVEYDHPSAMDFLKRDCSSITHFFERRGLSYPMSVRALFEFITDPTLRDEDVTTYLQRVETLAEQGLSSHPDSTDSLEERVFENKHTFIPRTLHQVRDPTGELFPSPGTSPTVHAIVTGVQTTTHILHD